MQRREFLAGLLGAASATALGGALWTPAWADHGGGDGGGGDGGSSDGIGNGVPPFDFSDSFYTSNGLDPTQLVGRVNGSDGRSVIDTTTDPRHRNVRVTATAGGFTADGSLVFFAVFANVNPATFLSGTAGQNLRTNVTRWRAHAFPRATGTGRRQDDVFENEHSFDNDTLNLWTKASVVYTSSALNTSAGQSALASLASKNGTDLDGTPMIRSLNDIENLQSQGFVTVTTLPTDGSAGPPWFLCPFINNPVGGSIAPNATLAVTTKPDGTDLVPQFRQRFNCLQATGSSSC